MSLTRQDELTPDTSVSIEDTKKKGGKSAGTKSSVKGASRGDAFKKGSPIGKKGVDMRSVPPKETSKDASSNAAQQAKIKPQKLS